MPETFSIDLDAERVLLDGAWYSREDLAHRIKAMVDAGDFKLGRPSAALEALEVALSELTTMTVKLPRGILNALAGAANRSGKSAEGLAREIIQRALAAPASTSVTVATPAQPLQPTAASVEPIPLTAPAKLVPGVPVLEAVPITLTPKKPAEPGAAQAPGESEQSWFTRR
jgi:hypothetical protein